MKHLELFEDYDFNSLNFEDLLALNLNNKQILDLIGTKFLNDEFKSVYNATNYPEISVGDTVIERKRDVEVPFITIGIGLESLFEFEKSPKGIEQLKRHLLGGKTLSPKKGEDDKYKHRIFPSLTIDILLTIHKEKLFCRIGGDFSIYVGDFPLLSYDVEEQSYVTYQDDVVKLLSEVLSDLNKNVINEINELNK